MADTDTPTLEVGFEIDFFDSFGQLKTLDDLIGAGAASAVREFQKIETASRDAVDLRTATAEIRSFGNASTRELANVSRDMARAEKSGEALSRQLDRQASTFGKSREEIRRMKVETAALAAEQSGLTELAGRLRAQEAALYDQEFAAARRARQEAEAAAEEKADAARRAVAAAEQEAAAVREAAFAYQMFEAKARQGIQAMREQEAADRAAAAARADIATRTQRFIQTIDPAAAAQARFNNEMAEARALIGAGAISLDQYSAKLRQEQAILDDTNNALRRGAVSAGAHRQAMSGASYQVQDFITQVSMGANPVNAFAVQGAQLAGQFQEVGGKAGAVARFFMGPWGLAITAGLMVLGPLVSKLMEQNNALDDAVDKLKENAEKAEIARQAQERFKNSTEGVAAAIREGNDETKKWIESLDSAAEHANRVARKNYEMAISTRQATIQELEHAKVLAENARGSWIGANGPNGAQSVVANQYAAEVDRINARLKEQTAAIAQAQAKINVTNIDLAAEVAARAADPIKRINDAYDNQVEALKRSAAARAQNGEAIDANIASLTTEFTRIERNREAALKAEQSRQSALKQTQNQIGRTISLMDARAIAEGIGGKVTSAERSTETQKALYDKYMAYKNGTGPWAALAAKPGTSNHELGQALDIAKTDGITLKKLVAAYRAAGVRLTEALDEGSHYHIAWAAKKATAAEKAADKAVADMQAQRMEAQGAVWKLQDQIQERNKTQWTDGEFAQRRSYDLQVKSLDVGGQILEQDERHQRQKDSELATQKDLLDLYLQQLDAMSQIGGIAADAAGVLAGLATGNFGRVRGKVGQILDGISLTVGKDGWKAVTDKLDGIFGKEGSGSFAAIMKKTFAAGGIGQIAGSSFLGSKNSELGSFAGGALGEKFGEKFLSKGMESIMKGLGDFAGPLGSIVGGVLGGALGGLFQKAKWGTAVVTGQDAADVNAAGNKAAYTSNANLAGNSIQTGLQAIADQLGADIGGYNVSIGQYKGKWRVSTAGRTGKLKGGSGRTDIKDFGEEGAEDAIKYAIADAISDGALLGLRASTQRLMQGGLDVEKQLQKALQFEGVFSELKSITDPVGYAIENLDKQFAQLRKTFDLAGASAEEYAQLQQLYDLKRVEALKQANAEAESLSRDRRTMEARILELQGNAVESVAIMRKIELEQMKESLRPLQEQIWALEDAAEAAAAAKQLQEAWKSIGDGIMDEVNRLRGVTDAAGGGNYQTLLGQFNDATAKARSGDQDAAGKLASLSKSVADAAELSATSKQEFERVKAMIAASLEATYRATVATSGAVAANTVKPTGSMVAGGPEAASLAAAATVQAAMPAPSNDNVAAALEAFRDEIAAMRDDMMKGLAQVASNTGKTARILDDVSADSGGQALSVAGAAK